MSSSGHGCVAIENWSTLKEGFSTVFGLSKAENLSLSACFLEFYTFAALFLFDPASMAVNSVLNYPSNGRIDVRRFHAIEGGTELGIERLYQRNNIRMIVTRLLRQDCSIVINPRRNKPLHSLY